MYSESERPWFAWFFVLALLISVACYATWGFQIFKKGWCRPVAEVDAEPENARHTGRPLVVSPVFRSLGTVSMTP